MLNHFTFNNYFIKKILYTCADTDADADAQESVIKKYRKKDLIGVGVGVGSGQTRKKGVHAKLFF